ncbi:MAG: CBS domain-containing protein [Bacteroidota bacterium]
MKQNLTINEIMTSQPVCINLETRIPEIITIMGKYEFDHLPVLNDEGLLRGMVSKTDLYQRALSLSKSTSGKLYSEKSLFATKAAEIMTSNPIYIETHQDVKVAIRLMLKDKFHALPVMEEGRIVGIITAKDILETMSTKVTIVS